MPSNAWCRGSYLPGPHVRNSAFVASSSAGDSATIAPTFRVGVGPSVQPPADSGRQGVVHRRMAQGAGDADRRQLALIVDRTLHTDDGVEAQELDGDRRIPQIDLTRAQERRSPPEAAPSHRPSTRPPVPLSDRRREGLRASAAHPSRAARHRRCRREKSAGLHEASRRADPQLDDECRDCRPRPGSPAACSCRLRRKRRTRSRGGTRVIPHQPVAS